MHTDVPEFRGANRKIVPQWLLVVMHHSGLFDEYRMPIATAIAWFHDCDGGELSYWPDGRDAQRSRHTVRFNTAMVLDTDSVFHGVDRVLGDEAPLVHLRAGMRLHHDGGEQWTVRRDGAPVAEYTTAQLRYSISWKAYCFADEAERSTWANHTDDLTLDLILDTLVADLDVERPASDADLGRLLIDRYIHFPQS